MASPSMSHADREALEQAVELQRPLARAARMGRSNAIGYAVFGALTLLVAGFGPDAIGLLLGALVTGVGVAQMRAASRLRRGDPAAPRAMARNELVLMGGIVIYCLLKLTVLSEGQSVREQLGDMQGPGGMDLGELADSLNALVYSSVLAVTLIYQGGLALYFLRRRAPLERYLAEAPDWARETVESLND